MKATYEKKGKHWRFEVRIDREYPFTRPQLHSLDKQNNLISEARDLLAMVLDEGQNWGPYLMLNKFIEDIPQLVSKI
jgi:ubiquitin-protein ligase